MVSKPRISHTEKFLLYAITYVDNWYFCISGLTMTFHDLHYFCLPLTLIIKNLLCTQNCAKDL